MARAQRIPTTEPEQRHQGSKARGPGQEERDQSPLLQGTAASFLVMCGITLGLFFLPPVNGLVGGILGGFVAGNSRRAVVISLIPALIVMGLTVLLLSYTPNWVVALVAGVTVGGIGLLTALAVVFGAAFGGAIAGRRWRFGSR